jgi:transcriptional regulator with XRE-family HTH domain
MPRKADKAARALTRRSTPDPWLLILYRTSAGISQSDLARDIEANRTQIWRWENADRPIPGRWVEPIAAALSLALGEDVEVSDLCSRGRERKENDALRQQWVEAGRPDLQEWLDLEGQPED